MKVTHEYKVPICSTTQGFILIDNFAIEIGHTAEKPISNHKCDTIWEDAVGNEITSGFRLTNDRKSLVLITIVNSYEREMKHKLLEHLIINN